MKSLLKDRIAVITGAGGGIGRAVASELAGLGMKIVLFGGNNLNKLRETAEIVAEHSEPVTVPGDLTDPDFIISGAKRVLENPGGVDVLINNAGMAMNTPFEDVELETFDRIMALNVRAPFLLTRELLPALKKSSAASIINIASVVAHSGYPMQSIYAASKHALLGMTKSLAREYFRDGIRVHAISPGGVYTDMVKISRPDLTGEGMIMPEEVAGVVAFLLTSRGNAVIDEILLHRAGKEPFLV